MRRVFAYIIVVLFVFTIFLPSLSASWEKGNGWGYVWESDLSKSYGMKNFTGNVSGKVVEGLYVKYAGEENGIYNFTYFGSYYTYGRMDGKFGNSTKIVSCIKMFWINFDGYILLKKSSYSYDGENYTFYGAVKQYVHIHTKKPMDLQGELNTTRLKWITISSKYKLSGDFDMKMLINYNRPVPYILLENGTIYGYILNISYSVNAYLDLNGYYSYHTNMGNASKFQNISVEKNVNFRGNTGGIVEISRKGTNVTRPGLIENVPLLGGTGYVYMHKVLGSRDLLASVYIASLLISNRAEYKNGFYENIEIKDTTFFFKKITSTMADEQEIKDISSRAPDMYGEYGRSTEFENWIMLGVVVGMVIVAIAVSIYARKR